MKTMEEKVALVTGSATGIGLACAQAFAKAGYITVLADICLLYTSDAADE